METINKTKLETLVNSFCTQDPYRPAMRRPALIEGYIYATDGHRVIRLAEDKADFIPLPNPEYPNILKVWSDINLTEPFNLQNSQILNALNKVSMVDGRIECDNCDGDGTVNCPCCDHDSECEDCNGKGYFPDKSKQEYNGEDYQLSIKETFFNPNLLNSLPIVCKFIGVETIKIKALNPSKTCLFEIGDFEIVIMPAMKGGVTGLAENIKVL